MKSIKFEDIKEGDIRTFVLALAGGKLEEVYEPYCRKHDCPCVVLESPVVSMREYGMEGFYQALMITVNNPKMDRCEDRQIPEDSMDGKEPLDVFLKKRMQRSK